MKHFNSTRSKTKIIAPVGPISRSEPLLRKMINAGMNVTRLNLSHGSYEDHKKAINRIRSLSNRMGKPVAIMMDLQGPKLRTGKLKDGKPVMLKRNGSISINTNKIIGTRDLVSTTYENLVQDIEKRETVNNLDEILEIAEEIMAARGTWELN
jgi:pyruvate kinase